MESAAKTDSLPSEAELSAMLLRDPGRVHCDGVRVQAMAREILRMRRDCPPTAEVEQLRRERQRAMAALAEAAKLLDSAAGRHPMPAPSRSVEETFGIFGRLRKLCDERDTAMHEADAWKQKVDQLQRDMPSAFGGTYPSGTRFVYAVKDVSIGRCISAWAKSAQQLEDDVGATLRHILGKPPKPPEASEPTCAHPKFGNVEPRFVGKEPNFGGKVGPATGQPRTEAQPGTTLVGGDGRKIPLVEPDGGRTVLDLGEGFRRSLANAVDCLPSDGNYLEAGTIKIAIRNLHRAVAELAKVVERIGAR